MIQKITDIFHKTDKTFSLEFFPPKTPAGIEKLYETAAELNKLGPDFISVTYGAGGSTRGTTMDICDEMQKRFDLPVMHHFTCVGHSTTELQDIMEQMKKRNIMNILALRGDPPKGVDDWKPAADGLQYCYQLNDLIRTHGDYFNIGVAGFPEGHINCPDKETDSRHMKIKVEHGGEFIMTQLFFDNTLYTEYIERLQKHDIKIRVLPGILPITSYEGLLKFCATCGATVTDEIHDIFRPIKDDEEAVKKAGIEFAVNQCKDLLRRDAPGLHFFTLNKVEPVREIWKRLLS
ncbi:MAG: methylenetetrahydrofolate reductase [NAD(P)H] [Nitrospira sp.]|nr:methylenetetrahydrofolate reductase [NAD(P)H] [Nitrospira sp.]